MWYELWVMLILVHVHWAHFACKDSGTVGVKAISESYPNKIGACASWALRKNVWTDKLKKFCKVWLVFLALVFGAQLQLKDKKLKVVVHLLIEATSELRSVTCRMGSHSVTCHPTSRTSERACLNISHAVLDLLRPTPDREIEGWVDL